MRVTDLDATYTIDVTHEIPSEHVAVDLRWHRVDVEGELRVKIDGQIVGAHYNIGQSIALEWRGDIVGRRGYTIDGPDNINDPDAPPTLEPGSHDIELEVRGFSTSSATYEPAGDWNIDIFAVYDDRYPPTLPNSTDSNNVLPVSDVYPASHPVRFVRERPFGAVKAASLSTTWTDGDVSGSQSIAVSNDRGQNWSEQSNATALDVTFDEFGPAIEFRTTISALSSGGLSRTDTQALEAATLSVDTSGSPIVETKTFRDPLLLVLQSLADRGDVLFEVRVIDGEVGLVVTYPGQRTADVDPELIDYRVTKKPMEQITGLRISGRSESISREEFTAQNDGVLLEHDSIKEGSETVRDPSTGDVLERGEGADYQMAYDLGEIRRTPGSQDMTSGETYTIDYSWQPSARISQPTDGGELLRTRARNIPELVSEQECREAAHFLLRQLEDIPWEATVEISDAVGWSLADAIDPDELPGSGPYRVRSLDESPESVTAELGRGTTVGEAVDELRGRLSSTEREV